MRGTLSDMTIAHVNLVVGGDEFLASQRVRDLERAALEEMPGADVNELDAGTATVSDFRQATGITILSPQAVAIISNLQNAGPDLSREIAGYARRTASEPDGCVLICRHDGGAKGQALVRELTQAKAQRSLIPDLRKPQERVGFVTGRFKELGRGIEIQAARQLAAVLGDSPGELYAMCSQLCEDFDDDPITLARVNDYMSADPRVGAFQVSDAAMAGNLTGAVLSMREALEQGVPVQVIIGALAGNMRTIAKAAAVNAGTLTEEESGVPRWLLSKARGNLRGWDGRGMCRAFEALAAADEQSKTNGGDEAYALEKAVECIASKGRM